MLLSLRTLETEMTSLVKEKCFSYPRIKHTSRKQGEGGAWYAKPRISSLSIQFFTVGAAAGCGVTHFYFPLSVF
jgi:hypothetical protein